MTVTTTVRRANYIGNNVTTNFAVPFQFFELSVFADGVLIDPSDYSIVQTNPGDPGTVVFNTAPAAGVEIAIVGDTDIVQEIDYQETGPFPAQTHERGLDRLTMICRELSEVNDIFAAQLSAFSIRMDDLETEWADFADEVAAVEQAVLDAESAAETAEAAAAIVSNTVVGVLSRSVLKALDSTVNTSAYLKEAGREGVFLWSDADLSTAIIRKTITSTAVYPSTDMSFPNLIAKATHELETGHAVFPTTSVNGLTANTLYYVIRVDVDNIRLASTFLNAHAGTAVALSGNTNFTLKRHGDPGEGLYVIPPGHAIDGSQGAWIRHSFQTVYNGKWFGVKGDNATDDTAAIQFTIDALPDTGGEAYFPRGQCLHSRPIRVGDGTTVRPSLRQSISIRGDGVTSAAPELGAFAVPSPTTFKYTGALEGTAWFVNGAIGGLQMRGFEINGNALAGRGMRVRHAFSSRFDDIIIRGWRNTGLEVDAHRKILDQPIYDGCSNNIWQNVRVYGASITSASAALILGVSVADIGDSDVNRNTFVNCLFFAPDHAGASAALLRYCDLINFVGCLFYSPGSISAAPIRVVPPTGNAYFPSGICFYNSSLSGQMVLDPAWQVQVNGQNRGLHFYPFTSDSLAVEPNSDLVDAINGFDMHGNALGRVQATTFKGGVRYQAPAILGRDQQAGILNSSTTLTTLATLPIKGGLLRTDRNIVIELGGTYRNNSGGASNFLLEVLYGSTVIFSSGNISMANNAAFAAVDGRIVLAARDGDAAKQLCHAVVNLGAAGSGSAVAGVSTPYVQSRNGLTEASASDLNLIVRAQHSVNHADTSFTLTSVIATLR